ncbi:MAG: AmmeMemoRadiSam system protein B [Phycisphaera sp.]|nr:AmmeMemoRadiSam system protein B [Phycisphaera sp.]
MPIETRSRSQWTRPAAVAGMFYPDHPRKLIQTLSHCFEYATGHEVDTPPKAIIAPHAGYTYSGLTAAAAYKAVLPRAGSIRRVVILGPSHREKFNGLAASSASAFDTPMGEVAVDVGAVLDLLSLSFVHVNDKAHEREHCIEVQLPLILHALGEGVTIVPLLFSNTRETDILSALERVWGGGETLIVISSDLSHYHDYDEARLIDRATSMAVESLEPGLILDHGACGAPAIRGLMACAREHHLHAHVLDLRNSGDVTGDHDRVVGYGAYAFA